jgi:hypothetical protein
MVVAEAGDVQLTQYASWGSSSTWSGGKMNMALATDQSTVVTNPDAKDVYSNSTTPITLSYNYAADTMIGNAGVGTMVRRSGGVLAAPPPSLGNKALKVGTWSARITSAANGYSDPVLTVYPDGLLVWSQYYNPGHQMPSSTTYASASVVLGTTGDQNNLSLLPGGRVLSYIVDKDAFVQANTDPTKLGSYWIRAGTTVPSQPLAPASIQNTSLRTGMWSQSTSTTFIEVTEDGTFNYKIPRNFTTPIVVTGKLNPLSIADQNITIDKMKVVYIVGSDVFGVNNPDAPWEGYTYFERNVNSIPVQLSAKNTKLAPGRWVGKAPESSVVRGPYADLVIRANGLMTYTAGATVVTTTAFKFSSAETQTDTKGGYKFTYLLGTDVFAVVNSTKPADAAGSTWYFQRDRTFVVPTEPITLAGITQSVYFLPAVAGVIGLLVIMAVVIVRRRRARDSE